MLRSIHPDAGKPAPRSKLVNVPKLMSAYYTLHPDISVNTQRVSFGTSGHRGSSLKVSFNEDHVLAITQAIADFRKKEGITGPLFLGKDTHALSELAWRTAIEVLAANGVTAWVDPFANPDSEYTPTPVISHAILHYNKGKKSGLADGMVITPSHNPPQDGGLKYNPPHGGPADTAVTTWIENRANDLLTNNLQGLKRIPYEEAFLTGTEDFDYLTPYVNDLKNVIDMEAIRGAGLKIGADPMGGAGIGYWGPIAEKYRLNIEVVNPVVDHTFSFMPLDHDGEIRMDCSSPYAMANLVGLKDKYDIAFGNDTDFDRHGIVTPMGLMNPNDYLSVAIWYLFQNRGQWYPYAGIGKTMVSSSMIDRVAKFLNRKLIEVPAGFKWFVNGLLEGSLGFGGEESAGASFLRRDGTVWVTEKDGFIMDLLAAEILATTGKDPSDHYQELTEKFGKLHHDRKDPSATPEQATVLKNLTPEQIAATELAGSPIVAKLNRAPGNNEELGGIKIIAEDGSWIALRPSGTEPKYKIYAESTKGSAHLEKLIEEAGKIANQVFQNIQL